MSLEDSMNNLARAMDRYADVIEKYGTMALVANGEGGQAGTATTTKAAEPAAPKSKGGRPKKEDVKTDAPAGDGFGGDGFGGDEPSAPDNITADSMKAKLLEVRDAHGDKQPALDIIGKYGYAAIPDIKPADYKKIWIDCEKSIADAG